MIMLRTKQENLGFLGPLKEDDSSERVHGQKEAFQPSLLTLPSLYSPKTMSKQLDQGASLRSFVLKTSSDGKSTSSCGKAFQGLITLVVKKSQLSSRLNLTNLKL